MTENLLTRDQILSADDLSRQKINVKEWGGAVLIRPLTADEREEFESFAAGKPKAGIQARLLSLSIIDDDGRRIFSDDDIAAIGKKSATAVGKVFRAVMKTNAMSDEDIKELEKNL